MRSKPTAQALHLGEGATIASGDCARLAQTERPPVVLAEIRSYEKARAMTRIFLESRWRHCARMIPSHLPSAT